MIKRSNEEILKFFGLELGTKIQWKDKKSFGGKETYELKVDEDGLLAFFDITAEYGFYDVVFIMANWNDIEVVKSV